LVDVKSRAEVEGDPLVRLFGLEEGELSSRRLLGAASLANRSGAASLPWFEGVYGFKLEPNHINGTISFAKK
jgi:hypothetical protein